jgi:hypothetical protein
MLPPRVAPGNITAAPTTRAARRAKARRQLPIRISQGGSGSRSCWGRRLSGCCSFRCARCGRHDNVEAALGDLRQLLLVRCGRARPRPGRAVSSAGPTKSARPPTRATRQRASSRVLSGLTSSSCHGRRRRLASACSALDRFGVSQGPKPFVSCNQVPCFAPPIPTKVRQPGSSNHHL